MQRRAGSLPGQPGVVPPGGRVSGELAVSTGRDCPACGERLTDGRLSIHIECRDEGDHRWCTRCLTKQPVARFSRDVNRRGSGGFFPWCKTCQSRSNRRAQEGELTGLLCPLCDKPIRGHRNRRYCSPSCKDRTKALSDRYGLTIPQYRELVEAMNGVCPICQKANEQWHVDHDHQTGRVTGVVCGACNVGALARTFHDPEFIRRLLDYVEHPPAEHLGAQAPSTAPSTLHEMWEHSRRAGVVP